MYLVLRAEYTVIYSGELFISHLFKEYFRSITLPDDVDQQQLVTKLLHGITITMNNHKWDRVEKLIIMMSKQLKECFIVLEKEEDLRRQANMRGVLITANKSDVNASIIKEYFNNFDAQPIYLFEKNKQVQSFMKREGLFQIKSISKENIFAIQPQSIILVDEKDIQNIHTQLNMKYLLFSFDNLRIGPLLIPGVTVCLECYAKYHLQKGNVEQGYPAFYNNFILNFLVNTVYFCLQNLHTYLGSDVGLPIRKYYELKNPGLSLSVTHVYKTSACKQCFES